MIETVHKISELTLTQQREPQYTIVNSDTKDQHQYSVIVSTTTIHSAHHPADFQAHTEPRLTKHIQHAAN